MASNIVRFDAIRSVANGSITGSYAAFGSAFGHAMRILHFANGTNADVFISFDGTTDNLIVPAGGFVLYDFTSDEDPAEQFRVQNGTQVYLKYSSSPSSGTIYLISIYGKGE